MKLVNKIREYFLWKLMNDDERRIWLLRKAQKLHIEIAKNNNWLGHSSDCCDRELLKIN
jgi:hypothetical protein